MRIVQSKDNWNGIPVHQFDFLMTTDATASDLGEGNVRVLVSARMDCAPHVKWVWSGTKRKGWAKDAYQWLAEHFGQPLKVSGVIGDESVGFHREMKKLKLISSFSLY
jgi:hypothetical protein